MLLFEIYYIVEKYNEKIYKQKGNNNIVRSIWSVYVQNICETFFERVSLEKEGGYLGEGFLEELFRYMEKEYILFYILEEFC